MSNHSNFKTLYSLRLLYILLVGLLSSERSYCHSLFEMRSNQKQIVEVIRIKCRAQVCHNVRRCAKWVAGMT